MEINLGNNRINFIPEFVRKEKQRNKRMVVIACVTFLICMFLYLIYLVPELKLYQLQKSLEYCNLQLKYDREDIEMLNELKQNEDKINIIQKLINEVKTNDYDISALMKRLENVMPEGVRLVGFTIYNTAVDVKYSINNPIEMDQLVKNLKAAQMFENVERPNIPMVDRTTDISFKLNLRSDYIKNNLQRKESK